MFTAPGPAPAPGPASASKELALPLRVARSHSHCAELSAYAASLGARSIKCRAAAAPHQSPNPTDGPPLAELPPHAHGGTISYGSQVARPGAAQYAVSTHERLYVVLFARRRHHIWSVVACSRQSRLETRRSLPKSFLSPTPHRVCVGGRSAHRRRIIRTSPFRACV